jgi:hypothetical protein
VVTPKAVIPFRREQHDLDVYSRGIEFLTGMHNFKAVFTPAGLYLLQFTVTSTPCLLLRDLSLLAVVHCGRIVFKAMYLLPRDSLLKSRVYSRGILSPAISGHFQTIARSPRSAGIKSPSKLLVKELVLLNKQKKQINDLHIQSTPDEAGYERFATLCLKRECPVEGMKGPGGSDGKAHTACRLSRVVESCHDRSGLAFPTGKEIDC